MGVEVNSPPILTWADQIQGSHAEPEDFAAASRVEQVAV